MPAPNMMRQCGPDKAATPSKSTVMAPSGSAFAVTGSMVKQSLQIPLQVSQHRDGLLAENAPCAGKAESDGQHERGYQRSSGHAGQQLPWQVHDPDNDEPGRDTA